MANSKTITTVILSVLIFSFITTNGCGIYTTGKALKPPFGQHRDDISLTFSGDNTDFESFKGYVLWYKGDDDIDFFVCEYNGTVAKPTISPIEVETPPWPYTKWTYKILFEELVHQKLGKNFEELLDDEEEFQFAVSSYGIDEETKEEIESEKVIF